MSGTSTPTIGTMKIINAKIDLMFLSSSSDNEKSFSIKKNFLNWKNKTMFLRRWRGSSISNYRRRGCATEPPPCTYVTSIFTFTINSFINFYFFIIISFSSSSLLLSLSLIILTTLTLLLLKI